MHLDGSGEGTLLQHLPGSYQRWQLPITDNSVVVTFQTAMWADDYFCARAKLAKALGLFRECERERLAKDADQPGRWT
jgi:predicted transcriptional regulator